MFKLWKMPQLINFKFPGDDISRIVRILNWKDPLSNNIFLFLNGIAGR